MGGHGADDYVGYYINIDIEEIYYISNEERELNELINVDSYNRIISKLDKKEQEIVSLKILSNLSFKEIAHILNEPIGTIKWKCYKSVHTLKILLSSLSRFIITFVIGLKTMSNTRKSNQEQSEEQILEKEEKSV